MWEDDAFRYIIILGVGKSKKLAKRNAASAMLQTLKQGTIMPDADGQSPEDGYDEDLVVSDRKYIYRFQIAFG